MRTVRLMGTCPHCARAWVELVRCTCTHAVTSHRIDLKRVVCEIQGCPCREYAEAEGQEDVA